MERFQGLLGIALILGIIVLISKSRRRINWRIVGSGLALQAIVGFLVWNYPRGKVFLGDAGAYFLGFMYAELSIQIVARARGAASNLLLTIHAARPTYSAMARVARFRSHSRVARQCGA